MAKRRAQNALAGLGRGLQDATSLLWRNRQADITQDRMDARQKADDLRQAALQIQGKVATGELDPDQAASMLSNLVGSEVAPDQFASVRPSMRRRMGKRFDESIEKADKTSALPTDDSIAAAMTTEGAETLPPEWSAGMLPIENDPFQSFKDATVGRELASVSGAKRRVLESEPTERFEVENPDGSKQVQFGSKFGGPVQTAPTAQQQGELEGTKAVAKETTVLGDDKLTDLKGKTQARIDNLVEALTRQAKVQTAAATASATGRASKLAGLAPDVVALEVDRARQLASGNENSTESERRAATNWAPLVKAHSTALDLEKAGATIGTWDDFMTKVPLANRMVTPKTRQYMQSARDFISTLGLIRSGVTVRPDEAESLFSTMFRTTGDDDTTTKNKQQSREVFLASMQAMVGRSGDEAGRILAAAINQGQIPASVLSSLQFDNTKLKDALLQNLSGIPQFDINGNPINVRR